MSQESGAPRAIELGLELGTLPFELDLESPARPEVRMIGRELLFLDTHAARYEPQRLLMLAEVAAQQPG